MGEISDMIVESKSNGRADPTAPTRPINISRPGQCSQHQEFVDAHNAVAAVAQDVLTWKGLAKRYGLAIIIAILMSSGVISPAMGRLLAGVATPQPVPVYYQQPAPTPAPVAVPSTTMKVR